MEDRFNAGFTWFDRTTDDTFTMYQMGHSPGSGVNPTWIWDGCSSVFERTTAVRNRGYEFDLGATILQDGDWSLRADLNLTYMANTVTGYDPADFHGRKVGSGIFCTCNGLGIPVSSLYGYNVDATGTLVDETEDGRVDEADMVLLGTTVPTVFGGLNTTLRWKDLAFQMLIDGAAGHDVANLNGLVKDGVMGPLGSPVLTDKFVEKGDYLRLAQLGVSYRIPATIKYIKQLEARASVHNVATFTGYSGWNPDVNCFGVSPLANGIDYGSFPQARMFLLGITAKF